MTPVDVRHLGIVLLAVALVGAFGCPRRQQTSSASKGAGRRIVPETTFVTSEGKTVHFHTDLVKGRTVLVNFIYTSCKVSCPFSGRNFAAIQGILNLRHDTSVALISISTDPEDTPEKLKTWARRLDAPAGWTLLSGTAASVREVSEALTGATAAKGEHMAAILIGDDVTGFWTRVYGLEAPEELIARAKSFRRSFDPNAF
jgi:protein SCO1/2